VIRGVKAKSYINIPGMKYQCGGTTAPLSTETSGSVQSDELTELNLTT